MAIQKYPLTVLLVLSTPMTYAQVVLDGTLGKAGELTGPNFAISADLGQQYGGNLFHSFQTFNVQTGETATFSGPESVENVISRVTGGQASFLNGKLQLTIPNADFYLLNPAGVMFGSDAKLDMSGSFHVSTANYLRLGENGRFDVSEPAKSVLTVAPLEAFGFVTESPGKIESDKSLLEVSREKTLSWVGGDLIIRNGHLAVGKGEKADGTPEWSQRGQGRINLVSVAGQGEVPVIPEALSEGKLGHITITDDTVGKANLNRTVGNVDASGFGGGKIYIRGGQITLDNGYVFADTWGNQPGQGIWVKAQEELAMRNGARITTETPGKAKDDNTGNAGAIQVQARQLKLSDGSQIVSNSNTAGTAGDVTVTADESIDVRGQIVLDKIYDSGIQSRSWQAGPGGQVNVSAPSITLSDGGVILTTTNGEGNAGNVTVKTDKLVLESGGHVSVSAGDKDSRSNGKGYAGSITITATQSVSISGRPTQDNPSGLRSNVFTAGKGGQITVNTPILTVQDGGSIESGTKWRGDGGHIILNTSQLTVQRDGVISSASLSAKNTLSICRSQTLSCGRAGDIEVDTDFLTLQQGQITTEALHSGGGNITLEVRERFYSHHGLLDAKAWGDKSEDHGGDLTIGQPTLFILGKHSTLNANANQGHGGNIRVIADLYIKSADEVMITATSVANLPGEISIDATPEDFLSTFITLPKRYSTPTKFVSLSCARKRKNQNTFKVILQEMLRPVPSDLRFFSPVEY